MKERRVLAVAVVAAFVLAACTDGDPSSNPSADPSGGQASRAPASAPAEKFAVITHGASGDRFWDVVKKGAEQAGKDLGVDVSYQSADQADRQAELIATAVTDKVDGLVVSLANPDALAEPVGKAVAAGIPVITINAGQDRSAGLGALAHVGQDETVAGRGAGTRLAGEGVRKLLCLVHEAGNVGLAQRCTGAKQTLAGGTTENLLVDMTDAARARQTISTKLRKDRAIDGLLALSPAAATAAVDAVALSGSKAKVATFGISKDVVDAIEAGKITFAVDQQQYEQGYLPVVMLHLHLTNANTVGGGMPVLTGPGFVTRENAARVRDLVDRGTR